MYVTIKQYYGQLGNHLFQIATAIAYGRKYNLPVILPKWKHFNHFPYLFQYCTLSDKSNIPYDTIHTHYMWSGPYTIPYMKGRVALDGYYQCYDLFKDYIEDIHQALRPHPDLISKMKSRWDIDGNNTCSIHVRRGDTNSWWKTNSMLSSFFSPVLPLSYYESAMKYMKSLYPNTTFYLCSDDMEWCKLHFKDVIFIDSNSNMMEDFICMMSCNHHIIGNSTFSWWSAQLGNEVSRTIAPVPWFGRHIETIRGHYIIPDDWIKMEYPIDYSFDIIMIITLILFVILILIIIRGPTRPCLIV